MEEINNVCPECCHKTKERSEKEKRSMLNRLSRIEGQVRGIRKMVENDTYCPDILIQVSAVNAALNSFNKVLLAEHIRTCVTEDIREGKEETIDELVVVLTGMSCAACSARVEKAVSKVPGVTSCSVSLLTNSMGVEGTADPAQVIAAVEEAGYGATEKGAGAQEGAQVKASSVSAAEDSLKDRETPKMKRRLIASLCFLVPLMYFSMGHMMWGWPVPSFLEGNHVAMGLIQLLLTTAVMVVNQKFFISGFKGLIHRAPNMDTLVALGAGASYGYSLYALFASQWGKCWRRAPKERQQML